MGYAHVTFSSKDQAEEALRKDGEYLGSRFLSIERAKPPKAPSVPARPRPAGCTSLFVKNLPYDTDEETVALAFRCVQPALASFILAYRLVCSVMVWLMVYARSMQAVWES